MVSKPLVSIRARAHTQHHHGPVAQTVLFLMVMGFPQHLQVVILKASTFCIITKKSCLKLAIHYCHAQDAVLSLFWHEGLDRDRNASRCFARMDIVTSTCTEKMSIRSWLTIATSYIRVTLIQPYRVIMKKSRSKYGRKQAIKERRPSLLSQAAGLVPILDR
ncbi:hypothetical protein ZWY2020_028457 [Hordeum vulgare]|nr:hypothetical protein ZWY2020_028457 [Hordeum vulgare]